uniref:Uncharacterized protein n=1 Tax=Meleagris gallopavo TaxID=9103 RepID=A0A803Y736_MELGA
VAAEGRFSPAEIPEPTLAENELRRGVFSGATLQLLCALAAIVVPWFVCPAFRVRA